MLTAPLDIIHQPRPDANSLSRAKAEEYLNMIAKALMRGWGTTLAKIANDGDFRRMPQTLNDPINPLLSAFRAKESDRGIMKVAVLINHQWVVKLGSAAIKEAYLYEEADDTERALYVPTVRLGNVGCLQLKVELPTKGRRYFDDDDIENQYNDLMLKVEDLHRANVGLWHGEVVAIDFEGG